MGTKPEFAEGSTLIRVPASVRDTLAGLRRRTTYSWGGEGPKETLGQVVARLAAIGQKPVEKKAMIAKPHMLPKRITRGRKVNNKARGRRQGRRHR